jgi:hypothetical protein
MPKKEVNDIDKCGKKKESKKITFTNHKNEYYVAV